MRREGEQSVDTARTGPAGAPPDPGADAALRRRRTEALAQLMREHDEALATGNEGYESVPLPRPARGAEDVTQEPPPVARRTRAVRPAKRFGFGPNLRRAAVVVAVGAAALVGFGSALLLPGDAQGEEARPAPRASPPPPRRRQRLRLAYPDDLGTLREGATAPR